MPQTSVDLAPGVAYPGQIADSGNRYSRSHAAEGAIIAGQPVLRGTDPEVQAIAIANSDTVDASTLAGWAVLETSRPYDATAPIAAGDPVTVMRQGRMYVQVSAAVVAGNPVYVGNLTAQLGDIDDGTGTGLVLCPGARFLTSAGVGELAMIEINLI